jgi:FxLD family lantipeptide
MSATETNTNETDGFDLDIRFVESSADQSGDLLNLTDDGCGASCPNACTTSR